MFTSLLSGFQGNENVDKLAKAALNRASCSGKLICWSDLKPKINAYIHSVWQKNWNAEGANKLHEMLPNLGEDLHRRGEGAGRKRETAMCRLRVGHTWLTQSYLLKNQKQPFCYACDSLYTVRHILIECSDFQDTSRKYFSVTDLCRLFREAAIFHRPSSPEERQSSIAARESASTGAPVSALNGASESFSTELDQDFFEHFASRRTSSVFVSAEDIKEDVQEQNPLFAFKKSIKLSRFSTNINKSEQSSVTGTVESKL
ncbi:ribonuclease hi [Plakobranchus ocellatus]|uniref:Ribonuclease hi n=1 Tax=Plakobranchus ocellatus TaxID=259542 RepID=A0AAV4AJ48_9GAST|nr:ribonuclease hi [Plakobranchus ocellatus]